MSDFDFETVRGLPGPLPKGEYILWQGEPDVVSMARRVFHVPVVAGYFGVLMVWSIVDTISAGGNFSSALAALVSGLPLAIIGLGLLIGLAWLNAATTVYTITNKRVVMRFGAALTKSINIPFSIIESASMKEHKDGTGDLALVLVRPNKIPLLNLWPHARPFRCVNPEPTFRLIPNVAAVAPILTNALMGNADQLRPMAALATDADTKPSSLGTAALA